ncbi:hypothetical protein V6N13_053743 [Hibiscus sabdariffa]
MPKKQDNISFSLEYSEQIVDIFNGIQVKWKFMSKNYPPKNALPPDPCNPVLLSGEARCFKLSFHKKHKEMILNSYMQHILAKAKEMMEKNKTLRLFTLKSDTICGRREDMWQSLNLNHPSTFQTMAMDSDLKKKIIEDLDRFMRRKEY